MEKRKEKRVKKRVMVTVDKKTGMLLDISEDGMKVAMSTIPASRKVTIDLQLGEQSYKLKAEIRWIKRKFSSQSLNQLGLLIKRPPLRYTKALKSLFPGGNGEDKPKYTKAEIDELFGVDQKD
jgi:hypothetical protein